MLVNRKSFAYEGKKRLVTISLSKSHNQNLVLKSKAAEMQARQVLPLSCAIVSLQNTGPATAMWPVIIHNDGKNNNLTRFVPRSRQRG